MPQRRKLEAKGSATNDSGTRVTRGRGRPAKKKTTKNQENSNSRGLSNHPKGGAHENEVKGKVLPKKVRLTKGTGQGNNDKKTFPSETQLEGERDNIMGTTSNKKQNQSDNAGLMFLLSHLEASWIRAKKAITTIQGDCHHILEGGSSDTMWKGMDDIRRVALQGLICEGIDSIAPPSNAVLGGRPGRVYQRDSHSMNQWEEFIQSLHRNSKKKNEEQKVSPRAYVDFPDENNDVNISISASDGISDSISAMDKQETSPFKFSAMPIASHSCSPPFHTMNRIVTEDLLAKPCIKLSPGLPPSATSINWDPLITSTTMDTIPSTIPTSNEKSCHHNDKLSPKPIVTPMYPTSPSFILKPPVPVKPLTETEIEELLSQQLIDPKIVHGLTLQGALKILYHDLAIFRLTLRQISQTARSSLSSLPLDAVNSPLRSITKMIAEGSKQGVESDLLSNLRSPYQPMIAGMRSMDASPVMSHRTVLDEKAMQDLIKAADIVLSFIEDADKKSLWSSDVRSQTHELCKSHHQANETRVWHETIANAYVQRRTSSQDDASHSHPNHKSQYYSFPGFHNPSHSHPSPRGGHPHSNDVTSSPSNNQSNRLNPRGGPSSSSPSGLGPTSTHALTTTSGQDNRKIPPCGHPYYDYFASGMATHPHRDSMSFVWAQQMSESRAPSITGIRSRRHKIPLSYDIKKVDPSLITHEIWNTPESVEASIAHLYIKKYGPVPEGLEMSLHKDKTDQQIAALFHPVKGVYFVKYNAMWFAEWHDIDRIRHRTRFSVQKYGHCRARAMAIEKRADADCLKHKLMVARNTAMKRDSVHEEGGVPSEDEGERENSRQRPAAHAYPLSYKIGPTWTGLPGPTDIEAPTNTKNSSNKKGHRKIQ